jgi:uncharacterized membrane protein YkoI
MKRLYILALSLMMMVLFQNCQYSTAPQPTPQVNDEDAISINDALADPINESSSNVNIDQAEAANLALSFVPGDTEEVYQSYYRTVIVWVVKVKTHDDCHVRFIIDIKFGIILNIESTSDSINYNILPSEHFISLSEAITISLKHEKGKIIKWELCWDKKHHWVYKIKIMINSKKIKIFIKAKSGDFIYKVDDND